MPDQEILNEMIEIYRDLNLKLRGVDLAAIADKKADNGETVRDILNRMRNREYNASQAIKIMSMGEDASNIDEKTQAAVLDELVATGVTPIILLSQFGTAREATLSLVRQVDDETIDAEHSGPRGKMSIREYCRALINDDRADQKLLDQLVETAKA
ncbi:MAG: hypothetical protein EA415_04355 [Sphaerobacteraceae bacterium]|nr:MAG: hypothetical protein EA415_04355 [Sphaerobacteraceae bacterium]